uniref:Uncharacterized protein n=1 Tax=viral metagenome TaxID=1070528 RepID=A0A6C0DVS8_9ZZZZ
MTNKQKVIDYLFEDPTITGQKFALVSIVGPHMPQKSDVWALKVRGTADTLESAKNMSQKLMRIDQDYDIYTVEVGKFFPLVVEPHQVGDVEYQNDQLNTLIKSYLQNRESANELWHKNKNEMVKQAIKEGQSQEEMAKRPEHPIAVLQRINNFEKTIEEIRDNLSSLQKDLELSKEKYSQYSNEERQIAENELKNAVEQNLETVDTNESSLSLQDIRTQIISDVTGETSKEEKNIEIENIMSQLKLNENELKELNDFKRSINQGDSPNVYKRTLENIKNVEGEISNLKNKLMDKEMVNSFINSNYSNSEYDYLNTSPHPRT